MHIQFDTLGGIAGDMFLAAVLDACPDLAEGTLAAIRSAGLPPGCRVSLDEHRDDTFRGKRFAVDMPREPRTDHVRHSDIAQSLEQSGLESGIRSRALAIFRLLAQAESEVHGIPLDDVSFHEVGAWDSMADIVGAAAVIDALKPASWSTSPIPLGRGRVQTAHGPMPVPAPATARLLTGFTLIDDGVDGERVTPTGAAILRYLRVELGAPLLGAGAPMRLHRSGTGFGTRTLSGISNILRVLLFEEETGLRADDRIGVVSFEVDDQTAEDLALGVESLRAREAVLDVLQMPAVGKKGRMVFHVQVLCRYEALSDVVEACFHETSTIGLRWQVCSRTKLARETVSANGGIDAVAVKLAKRPDGKTTAKAAADDVGKEDGQLARQRKRRVAEQRALARKSES